MGVLQNIGNRVSNAASAVGAAFSSVGNEIVDAGTSILNRAAETVSTFVGAAMPTAIAALAQLSYSGSSGNFQSATENIGFYYKFQLLADLDDADIGFPAYEHHYCATQPGFIQIANPKVILPSATLTEEQMVENYMREGFFYE